MFHMEEYLIHSIVSEEISSKIHKILRPLCAILHRRHSSMEEFAVVVVVMVVVAAVVAEDGDATNSVILVVW